MILEFGVLSSAPKLTHRQEIREIYFRSRHPKAVGVGIFFA